MISQTRTYEEGAPMPVHRYAAYFEPIAEGGYQVVFPNFPEIITFGDDLENARHMAADALRCHIEGLIKSNVPIPAPTPSGEPLREEVTVNL